MKNRSLLSLMALFLCGVIACGGSSASGNNNDAGHNNDAGNNNDSGTDGGSDAGTDGGTDGGATTAECDKAANVAKKAALLASQPTIGVKTKAQITATITFASVADNPLINCPVDLKFKDSNGNGTLDPYEDWTRTADARATDLAGRLTADQKLGLMAHATATDVPAGATPTVAAALQTAITAGIRFGTTSANSAALTPRAAWANTVQGLAEATAFGIPFVLSTEPSHSQSAARSKAKGFSQWPQELGLAATGDLTLLESYGKIVAAEYRAIGITMALSPAADLATDPRWFNNQFTFGEDSTAVAGLVGAYIKGLQGTSLSTTGVAAVVGHFPGAGATAGGFDGRLEKGKNLVYSGTTLDSHLAAFQKAFDNGVAGVMPAYNIPATGAWTALGGALSGTTIEQVGASFNHALITDTLRTHYSFGGLVVAPRGVLEDKGGAAMGAPWGMEASTKAQRIGKAVNAGVDQFAGLEETTAIAAAKSGALINDAQIDASVRRALKLIFQLGLFENPYVDAAQAPALCNTDLSYRAGLGALDRSMVLVINASKPAGWLNHNGDGTQTGDKGNAGNGSGLVLPAPPGEPYVSAGCRYYVGAGNIDLDYVRSVSAGYGELTNDESVINSVPVSTEADKMAASDYIFIRINTPYTYDTDSGPLNYSKASLEYASAENSPANAALLQPVIDARAAITSHSGSQAQIIVGIDGGRPSVVSELKSRGVTGIYSTWGVPDKVFFDVVFGIVAGKGKLPVGLPASDAAAAAQKEDTAGDGQDPTLVKGYGFQTTPF